MAELHDIYIPKQRVCNTFIFFVICVIISYNDKMSLFVIGSILHCQLNSFLHVSINLLDNIFKLIDPGLSEIEGFLKMCRHDFRML